MDIDYPIDNLSFSKGNMFRTAVVRTSDDIFHSFINDGSIIAMEKEKIDNCPRMHTKPLTLFTWLTNNPSVIELIIDVNHIKEEVVDMKDLEMEEVLEYDIRALSPTNWVCQLKYIKSDIPEGVKLFINANNEDRQIMYWHCILIQ